MTEVNCSLDTKATQFKIEVDLCLLFVRERAGDTLADYVLNKRIEMLSVVTNMGETEDAGIEIQLVGE